MTDAAPPVAPDSAPRPATRREWLGLAVIALPCLVYAMDMTVLNLALPAISADLRPSAAQLLWIVDVYGFLVAGFLITMGTLGDRIGRRRLLMFGAAAFAAASVLAAFAPDAGMLVAARALLGIAGATVAPSTMSLIRNMFHVERERQFAIGVWIASYSAGAAIGPLVGGALLALFWWGSVFLVALPVMLLLLILGPSLLPEYRDPAAGRVDGPSVVLSLAAVWMTVYAIKHLAENGPGAGALALLVAGLAVAAAFVRRQTKIAYPLLDLGLFRGARFSASIAAYGLSALGMMGVFLFLTQYLQSVLGLSPLAAGIATLPWALSFVVGSLTAPRLARIAGAQRLLVAGLLVAAGGFAVVALAIGLAGEALLLPTLVGGMVVTGLGMAPVFTVGNEMIITAAPVERAGAASALAETVAEFASALGIALFGSLGAWLYRDELQRLLGGRVPDEALAEAASTIGAAVATAAALPAPAGPALREAARAAFTDVLQLNVWIAVAIVLAAAVAAQRLLGRTPRPA